MRRPVPRGRGPALQDLRTDGDPLGLSGTIIRIDPTTGEGLAANPLGDSPDPNACRIVATGLRNPFRFTVRPGTNTLWLGDVLAHGRRSTGRGNDRAIDDFGWPWHGGPGGRGLRRLDLPLCEGLYGDGDVVVEFAYRHDQTLDDERCLTERGSSISCMGFARTTRPTPRVPRALFFADARGAASG